MKLAFTGGAAGPLRTNRRLAQPRARRAAICALAIGLASTCWAHATRAIELAPGDIVISDTNQDQLVWVDPQTGDRVILSSKEIGSGPVTTYPLEIQLPGDGSILVTDLNARQVFRIDPATGDRVAAVSNKVGCCAKLRAPRTIELDRDGSLIVADGQFHSLIRANLETGEKKTLSGGHIGTGPKIGVALGLALLPGNAATAAELVAVDAQFDTILRIDLATGNRTIVSSNHVGDGPRYTDPFDIVIAADGFALVTEKTLPGVLRVDLATGDRTLLSGKDAGTGPEFKAPFGMAIEHDGSILVTDIGQDILFRVDPASGNRSVVSSAAVGVGPMFGAPRRVAVVPGPPADDLLGGPVGWSLLVVAVGIAALSSYRAIRQRRA